MQRPDRTLGNGERRFPSNGGKQDRSMACPPSLALPTGGGAIREIDEKFAANPVTGTGSMSAPIATSPGRSDFAPQLSLLTPVRATACWLRLESISSLYQP